MNIFTDIKKNAILYMLVRACFGWSGCFKNLTKNILVYENDFENDRHGIVVSGWVNGVVDSLSAPKRFTFNGSKVLGKFNNCNAELILNNLPPHNGLNVSFDLYLHDQWKNNVWVEKFDGGYQYITGFSNVTGIEQAYPNWIGNGSVSSPAFADSYTYQLPGTCSLLSSPNGTSEYKMSSTIQHNKSSFQLDLSDAAVPFNDTCALSWSIDNLKIVVINN